MNKELSQKLFSNYKFLFQDPETGEIEQLMCFGFECGDGWYNILDSLFSELSDNVWSLTLEKEGLKREIEKTQIFIERPQSQPQNMKRIIYESQLKQALKRGDEQEAEDVRLNILMFDEAMERLVQSERERLNDLKKELENTDIEIELAKRNAPRVRQVKEKFGTLSVYGAFPESKQSAVNMAERLSSRTCEKCGSPGTGVVIDKYYYTLCQNHEKNR